MRILLGIDGSEGSLDAVRQVGALARAGRDTLIFYYAPPAIQFHERDANRPAMLEPARRAIADAVFAKAKEQLPAAIAGSVETVLGEGSPRTGLVAAVQEARADLLVVGARGTGPMQEVRLGGVARHVARSAAVPVLVTRRRRHATGPLRILFATDGSQASQHAAVVLNQTPSPPDAEGYVITVLEPFFSTLPDWLASQQQRDPAIEAMSQGWTQEHEAEKKKKHAELSELAKTLPAAFHDREPIVLEGHPAEQILRAIEERKIDLVVVGAQGKTAWQEFVIGSTSERLLSQAPCSVLVVRQRQH